MRTAGLLIACALVACGRSNQPPNKFSDPERVRLYDLADHRATDSLLAYLDSPVIAYRLEAARAFGSVQDSLAAETLGALLLNDPDAGVRAAAAWALGQTRCAASSSFLLAALDREKVDQVLRELLEAAGKTVSKPDIPQLLSFRPLSTAQEEGHAWGLYRMGVRAVADAGVVDRAADYLADSHPAGARLAAAHFFARTRGIQLESQSTRLQYLATHEPDAEVRMGVVLALRKLPFDSVQSVLDSVLSYDPDARVRINAVRASASGDYPSSRSIFGKALSDRDIGVQVTASEQIRQARPQPRFLALDTILHRPLNYRVRANLLGAFLKQPSEEADRTNAVKEVERYLISSASVYEQASLLSALGEEPFSFPVLTRFLDSELPVLRTAAMSAIASINRHPSLPKGTTDDFIPVYSRAVSGTDPFVCAIAAEALSDPALGYKELIKDFSFLKQALSRLSRPRDVEAVGPLEKAIAYFEGRTFEQSADATFNHPVDWNLVKGLPSELLAIIQTSKGDIRLVLLVDEAPGSVSNFVTLAQSGYFNNLYFHRVVPNFVIQGGCHRGDGYGSEAFSIRSEFSQRRYTTGSVGMASAGKDTEGTQWFITHSPTPHLDGAYTIFAYVLSGQDVVNQIEVGDKIIAVTFPESESGGAH
jgi:cyclophilin family peptidyl-prolyl cis-trans isomerase/HEAT repeat protein